MDTSLVWFALAAEPDPGPKRKAKPKPKAPNGQARLDKWFPTIVRYGGFGLMLYAALIDRGANPALIPTALGMILFKTVYGSGPPEKE